MLFIEYRSKQQEIANQLSQQILDGQKTKRDISNRQSFESIGDISDLVQCQLCGYTAKNLQFHLLFRHAITQQAYTFASLLTRIGDVSKLINYYDAKAKSLVEDIQKWALSLDGSDVLMGEVLPTEEGESGKEN